MKEEFISEIDRFTGFDRRYKKIKRINDQLAEIRFYEDINKDNIYYSVFFEIISKKKQKDKVTLKNTGRVGLDGLLWAKEQILKFIGFISDLHYTKTIYIIVNWDDNKRRKVYERGLKDLGFKYQNFI